MQYCTTCKRETKDREQRISALGALAVDMVTGVMTLMAASVCTPLIGWLFMPMVIILMFVVGPFAIVAGLIGSILPRTETKIICAVCGKEKV